MTNETDEKPDGEALPMDWEQIRTRYEAGLEKVNVIAQAFGMAGITLSSKAKALGWKLRGAPAKAKRVIARISKAAKGESTTETIRRLKELLNDRITNLEAEIKAIGKDIDQLSNEKKLRNVHMVVRTLEKVIDLERKDRESKRKTKRAFKLFDESQRGALAEKIERLEEGWEGKAPVAGTGDAGGGGTEPPVALLGEAGTAASAG
jgi:TolA-binding protein